MQVSWIDPEEVAALAESLRPAARPQAVVKVSPFREPLEPIEPLVPERTELEVDAAAMPNLTAFRQRLQSIREKAIHAGLLTPQAAVQTPFEEDAPAAPAEPPKIYTPPTTIPIEAGASIKERFEAFATWSAEQWGPGELLIVDEYGDLLWGPPKKSGLVVSTMMAWNAAIRASAEAANGLAQIQRQTLATGETLTIIPCPTRLGMLQIALVKKQASSDSETSALKEALSQIMNIDS